MAAIDDLTELVERAAVAEKVAVSSKWKERPDVEKMVGRLQKSAAEQRDHLHDFVVPDELSSRWVSLRQDYLDLGAQESLPEPATAPADLSAGEAAHVEHRLSHAAARQAERDAVAAVEFARMALTDAALAVLQARLARIDAGEDDPDAAVVDGHIPLHGKNPVSRHGPALAHGLSGEIKYILTRKPRSTVKSLAITLALGLLYLGWIRFAEWDKESKYLPYLGLWVIGVVMGGGVCINAMSFDAMRVRAALDNGERLWHLLVIKNLALLCLVAPIGFILCALLAWRAGDIYAFYKACALMVCMILLWLGVGNVLSIVLPSRDEPLKQRKQSGSLKQFIIAFVVSYAIGYLVNAMLVWRVFAAQDLTERLGNAFLPAVIVVISSTFMWILLTVLAVALSQQPKVRRIMQKEITDYKANAEMKAYAEEAAAEAARSGSPSTVDDRKAAVG
jgi:hypothetical protein